MQNIILELFSVSNLNKNVFLNNIISLIQMVVINSTPQVQSPIGFSLLHPLLNVHGYNQNCMKDE